MMIIAMGGENLGGGGRWQHGTGPVRKSRRSFDVVVLLSTGTNYLPDRVEEAMSSCRFRIADNDIVQVREAL